MFTFLILHIFSLFILNKLRCVPVCVCDRLMFEACGFIMSSVFVLAGVTLVLRVDVAVARLFQKLLPENSR